MRQVFLHSNDQAVCEHLGSHSAPNDTVRTISFLNRLLHLFIGETEDVVVQGAVFYEDGGIVFHRVLSVDYREDT